MSDLKRLLAGDLIAAADKLEESLMLKPGFFSDTIVGYADFLYDWVAGVTGIYVDYSTIQPDLSTLKDSVSRNIRVDIANKRRAVIEKDRLNILHTKHAIKQFFSIIKKPEYKSLRLVNLPDEIKSSLIPFYHSLQPYVRYFSELNDAKIVDALKRPANSNDLWETFLSYISYREDSIEYILQSEDEILKAIDKKLNSADFHLSTNRDLLDALNQAPETIHLSTREKNDKIYTIDEQSALEEIESERLHFSSLNGNTYAENSDLTLEQTSKLYEYYSHKMIELEAALTAFEAFQNKIESIAVKKGKRYISQENIVLLRHLYSKFQPYFVYQLEKDSDLDEQLVTLLLTSKRVNLPGRIFSALKKNKASFLEIIKFQLRDCKEKKNSYRALSYELFEAEQDSEELKPIEFIEREDYVIRHEEYSKALKGVKESISEYSRFFNQSVQEQLIPAYEGVPYPELTGDLGDYSHSSQVLLLKRLHNALYHFEQAFVYLEKLHNKSTQTIYVTNLTQASVHLYNLGCLASELKSDPFVTFLYGDIHTKIQTLHGKAMGLINPYLPEVPKDGTVEEGLLGQMSNNLMSGLKNLIPTRFSPKIEPESDDAPILNTTTMYVLNSLVLLPQHIKASQEGKTLEQEVISACHNNAQKVAIDISEIPSFYLILPARLSPIEVI